jgi:hypothetical protein
MVSAARSFTVDDCTVTELVALLEQDIIIKPAASMVTASMFFIVFIFIIDFIIYVVLRIGN